MQEENDEKEENAVLKWILTVKTDVAKYKHSKCTLCTLIIGFRSKIMTPFSTLYKIISA